MVDYFEHSRRMGNIRDEEAAGNVADSRETIELMNRVGEPVQ